MDNWHKNTLVAILMLITLFLGGCSNNKTIQVPETAGGNRNSEVTKCMDLVHGESTDRSFVYVYEKPDKKGEWRSIVNLTNDAEEYIAKGTNVYISFDQWRGKDERAVIVEYNPSYFKSSANWNRIDNYCFDAEGNIIEISSSLRLLDDNLNLVREWIYDKEGSVLSDTKKLTDLQLKKSFDLNEVDFLDKPPFLPSSYQDLIEYLKLSAEVNEGTSPEKIDLSELISSSDYPESEYLRFVSQEKSLSFHYRPDWVCNEIVSGFRVDCIPEVRMKEKQKLGLPVDIVYPEISITSNQCQLDPNKKVGDIALDTSDFEGPKYNTFYNEYNDCEVSVSAYSEIDTAEKLSKIIIE